MMHTDCNTPTTPDVAVLRVQGETAKLDGMQLAATRRRDGIEAGRIAMLDALLRSADGTATIDDATDDLSAAFRDGGQWRGTVTRSLAMDGLIVAVGTRKSDRPSRHRGYVTVWRLVDRPAAISILTAAQRKSDSSAATDESHISNSPNAKEEL